MSTKNQNSELSNRQWKIFTLIKNSIENDKFITSKKLAEQLGCSVATVKRDLKILKERGWIEFNRRKYCLSESTETEKIISPLTKQNFSVLASLQGISQHYKNTALYTRVSEIIFRLIDFINPLAASNLHFSETSRITCPPFLEYSINQQNWEKISSAIEKNKKIKFLYNEIRSETDSEIEYVFCPYQILLDGNDVLVFGKIENSDKENLFYLNRMKEIILLNDFSLPENFDYFSRCEGGILGTFSGENLQKYKIELYGFARTWILEHKISDDQKISEKTAENCTIVTFSTSQSEKLLELLIGFFRNCAKPVEPQNFVQKWKSEIQKMWDFSNLPKIENSEESENL